MAKLQSFHNALLGAGDCVATESITLFHQKELIHS